jgi:hypothetical protein
MEGRKHSKAALASSVESHVQNAYTFRDGVGKMRSRNLLAIAAAVLLAVPGARAAVEISKKPTRNMSCSGGICTPTARKAVLNATDLSGMLAGGSVTIESGALAQDIAIDAALSWTSGQRLTLDAYRGVTFAKPVVVAGVGALTITTNDGGKDGDFAFNGTGHVEFWDLASSLVINGRTYTLANSIKALADAITANPSGAFALSKSYNARHDRTYTSAPIRTELGGIFEGLGNTISKLAISSTADVDVGLFARTASGGTLRDIVLTDESIQATANGGSVGGLVGESYGTISGASVQGTIAATRSIQSGLVAGASYEGTIRNSSSSGSIVGNNDVGGVVGNLFDSTMSWTHSSATVSSAFAETGGLAGEAYSQIGPLSIDHCYATGNVLLTGSTSAGGLIGYASAMNISDSYATGAVTAGDRGYAGGLAGRPEFTQIWDSYATGSVTVGTNGFVGGLFGYKYNATWSSYSTGKVTGGGGSDIGGVIGVDATESGYNNSDLYWDLDTSGISDPGQGAGNVPNDNGITGLSDAELTAGLPGGFDPGTWGQSPGINGGYPYLLANPPR